MVVAVVSVGMVEVAVDQVVDMVPVRNGWMTAVRSVHMTFLMPAAVMGGGATIGVGGIDLQDVFIDVAGMRMMQVAVVQVVHMSFVLHGQVATARSVLMIVVRVDLAVAHGVSVGLWVVSV